MIRSSLCRGGRVLCARRPARAIVVTLGSLFVFLALLAGTVAGVEGPTSLSNPSVSPRSGSPTTRISFAVDYRNREGSAPAYVRVVIDGRRYAMRASGSLVYKSGVRFTYRTTLPAGTHRISFQAADSRRFTASASGGTVRIQAASSGSGSGTAVGGGGSAAGGSEGTGGGGSGGSGGSAGTTGSTPGSGAGGASSTGTDTPTGTPGVTPEEYLAPVRVVGEDVFLGWRGVPRVSAPAAGGGPEVPAPVDAGQPLGGVNGLSGGLSGLPPQLLTGSSGTITWQLRAFAVAMGTGGAAAVAMAFLFFGKRRRDGEQPAPDEVLQAAAATMDGYTASTQLVPPVAGPALDPAELAMPRWRRPSLLEARKKDPLRSASATYSLSFANGAVGLVDGLERRRIRYRVVRLLDSPDELRGTELGVLDQGDEVQLVERNGPFWFVRCPDGRQGWLHRMTLGDVVEDPPPVAPAQPTPAAQPAAPGDIPPATPDQDVLSSFLRREQAG